jgi:hypothetical protein
MIGTIFQFNHCASFRKLLISHWLLINLLLAKVASATTLNSFITFVQDSSVLKTNTTLF